MFCRVDISHQGVTLPSRCVVLKRLDWVVDVRSVSEPLQWRGGRVVTVDRVSTEAAMSQEPVEKQPAAGSDAEESVEEEEDSRTAQLMRDPQVLAALQGRLGGLSSPADYIQVSRRP